MIASPLVPTQVRSAMADESLTVKVWTEGEPRVDLVSRRFLEFVPRDFARRHLLLSQSDDERECHTPHRLAVAATSDPAALFNVGVHLGEPVEAAIADGEVIARVIDEVYGRTDTSSPESNATMVSDQTRDDSSEIDRLLARSDSNLLNTDGKGPIIKFIDALLFEALGRAASDIHIQPLAERTLIRCRLDGVLHTVRQVPHALTNSAISRLKVMARMDIAERRVPQDGRASVTIGTRSIDLRISTLPTSYGERAVVRLLDNSNQLCDFQNLGMPPNVAGPFLECSGRSHGMILLTGPTGSGKTTTLYSTLRRIGSDAVNMMSIEDPIEYDLSTVGLAISQSQVNLKKGMTFATGLRHILRQDPDVIMVGEIRDSETARIAIQSSLTGHLVFSTLHTNDASSAATRLVDLEVEPFLVSASLTAVLAQRLVRLYHQSCEHRGCVDCLNTGYRGRTGLFELMIVDERIRELINVRASLSELRHAAKSAGMVTLKEDGLRLVDGGMTSAAEAQRVVQGAS